MDLVAQLSSQLGLQPDAAKGLAGGLMGLVQNAVGGQAGQDVAAAVPEAAGWQQQAGAAPADSGGLGAMLGGVMGEGGAGLGSLLGSAGALVGGNAGAAMQAAGGAAAVSALLSKFGLGADKAAMIAPLLLTFLQSKLPPELLSKVTAALPMLTQALGGQQGGAGPGGGLGGLAGLLK